MPHKLPNNFTLKKLGHFKEISEILGIDGTATGRPPKREILTVVPQNCKKSAAKYSIEKPIPLISWTRPQYPAKGCSCSHISIGR